MRIILSFVLLLIFSFGVFLMGKPNPVITDFVTQYKTFVKACDYESYSRPDIKKKKIKLQVDMFNIMLRTLSSQLEEKLESNELTLKEVNKLKQMFKKDAKKYEKICKHAAKILK